MKSIDLNSWERATHYQFFKRMDYPQYNICANIDITRFLPTVKAKRLSFYYAMIFAASQVLNTVEAFRYRIRDDQVVLHEQTHPSVTEMSTGSELFKIVTAELDGSLELFVRQAKIKAESQECFIADATAVRDDLIYITCIPWVSFTHLSHPIPLNPADSVPRISWGKYFASGEKLLLPFSVQAHHALVDGFHMGKYLDGLQCYLDSFG